QISAAPNAKPASRDMTTSPVTDDPSLASKQRGVAYIPRKKEGSAPAAAAVHVNGIRRHERASVRAHEQHQFADFFRLAEAAHRNVVEEALEQFRRGGGRRGERGFYRAGRDRQAADIVLGEFA